MSGLEVPEGQVAHVPGKDTYLQVGGKVFRGGIVELWRRYAGIAGDLDRLFEKGPAANGRLTGVTLRPPKDGENTFLLVARAVRKGQKIVAFHRGGSAADCVEAFMDRLTSESVDWRDDSQASSQNGSGNGSTREPLPKLDGA